MQKTKSLNKKKESSLDSWIEKYFQAKQSGDKTKMKFFEDIIKKLGGKIPKL